MTDSEKELRRLAQRMVDAPCADALVDFALATKAPAVLALLDRIEALEAALKCTHGEDRIYCDKALSASVEEAERKGAEEMRERALREVIDAEVGTDRFTFAARIRTLPFPGDAP